MTPPERQSLQDVLEDAGRALLRNEPATAEGILRPAVVDHAIALSAAWATLGLALLQAEEEERADAEMDRALVVWDAARAAGEPSLVGPSEIEALVALLIRAERPGDALAIATAAAEVGGDPRLHAGLAVALNATGDRAAAAAAFVRSSAGWLDVLGAVDRALAEANLASGLSGAGREASLAVARALTAKGDVEAARQRYEEVLAKDDAARAPAFEAELSRLEGHTEAALASADAVLVTAPDDTEALAVRAQALRDAGRVTDAIQAIGRLLEAGGGDRFRVMRGSLRAMVGDNDEALADIESVGPLSSDAPLVTLIRAEMYLRQERFDESISLFERFLADEPGSPTAAGERALALFHGGRREEAMAEIEGLLREPPADPAVEKWMTRLEPEQREQVRGQLLAFRGQVHLAAERYPEARADLSAATEILGPRFDVTPLLAQSFVLTGDPDDALALIESLPPAIAGAPHVLAVKAAALGELDRGDEALETIDVAVAAAPGNPLFRRSRDMVLITLGRYEEAAADLEQLAQLAPQDRGIASSWAAALRGLGRDNEAIDVLEATLARFPDDASLWEQKGTLLAGRGDFPEAAEALKRCLELAPDQPNVSFNLGEYLRRQQRYDEALPWLNKALEADPESVPALGTKGQVLLAKGDRERAMALLRRAADLAGDAAPGWVVVELVGALSEDATPDSLAEALGRLDRYLAALRGSEVPPELWALATKAEVLRLLDRPAEGLDAADEALRAGGGDDETVLGTRAHLLADLRRPDEALEVADGLIARAAEQKSENAFARSARIRALAALDRDDEALAELDRYLDAAADDYWGLVTKAGLLCDYREFREALDILEALEPGNPYRDGLIGLCRNRLGDAAGAVAPLQAAVEGARRLWWCWAELGLAHRQAEDLDAARTTFQVLVDEATSSGAADPDLLYNAAWAAYGLGDPSGGAAFAQRALAIDPTNPVTRLAGGALLLATGRGLAALDEIEAAAAAAAERRDHRRGAAIVEEGIDDLERLVRDGAVSLDSSETKEALRILRETAERLRHPAPEVAT